MAIVRYAGDRYVGLSTDVKPTNVLDGAEFIETDTNNIYLKKSTGWVQVSPVYVSASEPALMSAGLIWVDTDA